MDEQCMCCGEPIAARPDVCRGCHADILDCDGEVIARMRAERDALRAQLAAARAYVASMAESVERARESRSGRGGQHVPYHGDYCAAVPSVLATLDRQTRELLALLADGGSDGE